MLGVLVLGFGGAWMTGACGASAPGPVDSCSTPTETPAETPTECATPMEDACMRYRIPLLGNPSMDVALRAKYTAAFGDACYLSEGNNTFNCFYKTWEKACEDAVKIGKVSGNAPYDEGYKCQPVGNGDYTLQVGSDVANKITIYYEPAPRQTPLVVVDGVPTVVSGPYRDLVDPDQVGPGNKFDRNSGMVGADGLSLDQRKWILEVNRKKNGGKIRSDLEGFTWPCEDGQGGFTTCEEPEFLADPDSKKQPFHPGVIARVHHVVPRKDKRCCPWGTNAYKNAAVISHQLNEYFTNNDPPEEEVKTLNNAAAYTP
jgi:hypothetical protein